jgi:hypothetical protein
VNERAREHRGQRRKARLAWLAVAALLLDALLPTSFAAAVVPGSLAAASRIFCGAAQGGSGPAKQAPIAPHHCALCLATAIGLEPGHGPAIPLPRMAEAAVLVLTAFSVSAKLFERSSAQPRGPPVAV